MEEAKKKGQNVSQHFLHEWVSNQFTQQYYVSPKNLIPWQDSNPDLLFLWQMRLLRIFSDAFLRTNKSIFHRSNSSVNVTSFTRVKWDRILMSGRQECANFGPLGECFLCFKIFGLHFQRLRLCINFDQKMSGLRFGRLFSQTHLVTLAPLSISLNSLTIFRLKIASIQVCF
jgi:hypothetical protein